MQLPKILTTRREFLQKGLGFVAASATVPLWLSDTAFALDDPRDMRLGARPGVPDDRILVVLQLSGGNDVLATVVPYGMDDYYKIRRATAIQPNDLWKLDNQLGLNNRLTPLRELWEAKRMAIVQAVSYPNPNRSHFHSMDIWHTCNHESPQRADGWLARFVESQRAKGGATDPATAVAMGGDAPRALIGSRYRAVSFQDPQSFAWRGGAGRDPELVKKYRELNQAQGMGATSLDFLAKTAMEANATTDQVRAAVSRFRPTGQYQGPLGRDLSTVAAMIAGGLKTRLYYVSQGGYDTHSGQRGRHDQLLSQLAANVKAFLGDLAKIGQDQRVVVMSFSEFGRRVGENASGGTDHGAAGAMFLFGAPVKGGVYGEHPSLVQTDRGDLQWKIDFRSVYATAIENWMGGDAKAVMGKEYPKLPLI